MRRLFTLLAGFLIVAAAGLTSLNSYADVYLYGNLNGVAAWDTHTPSATKFTEAYSYTSDNKNNTYYGLFFKSTTTGTQYCRLHDGTQQWGPKSGSDTGLTIDNSTSAAAKKYNEGAFTFSGKGVYFFKVNCNTTNLNNSWWEDVYSIQVQKLETLYVYGNTGNGWAFGDSNILGTLTDSDGDGKFTGTVTNTGSGNCYFVIATTKWSDWDNFNRLGAGEDKTWTTSSTVKWTNDGTYTLSAAGSYSVEVDLVNKTTRATKLATEVEYTCSFQNDADWSNIAATAVTTAGNVTATVTAPTDGSKRYTATFKTTGTPSTITFTGTGKTTGALTFTANKVYSAYSATADYYDLYLRWSTDNYAVNADRRLTQTDAKTYALTDVEIPSDTKVKIADSNWSTCNYGRGDNVKIDGTADTWYYNGNDGTVPDDFYGDISITLGSATTDNPSVTFTAKTYTPSNTTLKLETKDEGNNIDLTYDSETNRFKNTAVTIDATENWFRFTDGSNFFKRATGDETITESATTTHDAVSNSTRDAVWRIAGGKTYTVEAWYTVSNKLRFLIYENEVAVADKELYVYGTVYKADTDLEYTKLCKLAYNTETEEYEGNIVAQLNGTDNADDIYYLFVAEGSSLAATGTHSTFQNVMYLPADNDQRKLDERTGEWTAMSKCNDHWKFTLQKGGDYTVKVSWTNKAQRAKVVVNETCKYYLSGDINNWLQTSDNKSYYETADQDFINSADNAVFAFKKCTDAGKEGWYVCDLSSLSSRMHGQFQIHTGGWVSEHYGNAKTPRDSENHPLSSWSDATADQKAAYYAATTAEDEEHSSASAQGVNADETIWNMHLGHNYYKDAKIYLKPVVSADAQIYIEGTPQDIYVYYYNDSDDESESTAKEADCTKTNLLLHSYVVDPNNNNYHVNYAETAAFEVVTVDANSELATILTEQGYAKETMKVYRAKIANGLEQPYTTFETETDSEGNETSVKHSHYFQFGIDNALALGSTYRETLEGHDVYVINVEAKSVYVLSGLKDCNGNLVEPGSSKLYMPKKMGYRFMTINSNGKPVYVAEDGSLTENRADGALMSLDSKVSYNSTDAYGQGKSTRSLMSTRADSWDASLQTIEASNYNRYVEYDLEYSDGGFYTEGDGVRSGNHVYVSDFNYDSTATATSVKSDTQYKLAGKTLLGSGSVITKSLVTGVEEILDNAGNDAEPIFYNLQGLPVRNPEHGIYIRVENGTSTKVRL